MNIEDGLELGYEEGTVDSWFEWKSKSNNVQGDTMVLY